MDVREQTPQPTRRSGQRFIWLLLGLIILVTFASFGVAMLLVNIFERKQEARNPFFRTVELTDDTVDPAIWGKDFPQEYDGYKRTTDMIRTHFGGSEAVPRTPTDADPRSIVARSRLEEDPRLKIMWAGYSFSKDYRERRGHAYMLDDQTFTGRQQATAQPGTCLNCHASIYTTYKKLGDGDITKGFDKINHMSYSDARKNVDHPIACIDCHDPKTMQLRVTRPAFIAGIKVVKGLQGVKDYDVNTMATRQEMRSYVCAQCHDEYYFKGEGKTLTFPWFKGQKADQILAYYDEIGFKDWVHGETGAPVLKAQHPEFETWSQGIHARSGVACADCHMPYKRVGALKVSDHHVQSPLLNINNACQTCHHFPEEELKARVDNIQQTTFDLRNMTMDALMQLIEDIKAQKTAGASDEQLKAARDFQRKAQFLLDFVESENSMGFHAPQESARVLALSVNYSREGQNSLRPLLTPGGEVSAAKLTPTKIPDIVTSATAAMAR